MANQFNSEFLDLLLAPGISAFDSAEIPDLSEKFPESLNWIINLFLNSLFGSRYNESWHQASVSFLFRTQTALSSYDLARTKTLECINNFQLERPASDKYFEAVAHWETVLLNIQITLDLFQKVMSPQSVVTDDAERIRKAANRIKHFAEDIQGGLNGTDITIPLWLSSEGLCTRVAHVTYQELAENLTEMGRAADILQNPNHNPTEV